MTTAIIAEDEPLLREQMVELLNAAWPELEILAAVEDGAAAIREIDRRRPDVLFLDIQMPEATGLDVARHASGMCHVVFVTAYDQFAVSAFEEGAIDYVMKPLTGRRIVTAVQRVKQRLGTAPASLNGIVDGLSKPLRGRGEYLRWINASRGKDLQLVTVDEVHYFQSDTKYTRVVTAKREGLIRKSIKELTLELDPMTFWQIHRATIVNLNAVATVGRDLGGNVVLRLKDRPEELKVSQPFAHLFRQM